MIAILKLLFLFITIQMSLVNIFAIMRQIKLPSQNYIWWAIGLTGSIFLQFKMYM